MARRPFPILAVVGLCCLVALTLDLTLPAGSWAPRAVLAAPDVQVATSSPRKSAAAAPRLVEPVGPGAPEPERFTNLFRFLAGGLLAGCLWSVLFGYPFYSYWPNEPFPLGLLDLTVAATFLYLGYLAISQRLEARDLVGRPLPRFSKPGNRPVSLAVEEAAKPGLAEITARDPSFSLEAFGEQARSLIFDLHDAWNHQDVGPLRERLAENLLGFLQMGLKILGLRNEISRLEDLSLSRLAVVKAEGEGGRESITVQVEGQVMDYVLQRQSYKLLSGSLTYAMELKEYWLFERAGTDGGWRLKDILDY